MELTPLSAAMPCSRLNSYGTSAISNTGASLTALLFLRLHDLANLDGVGRVLAPGFMAAHRIIASAQQNTNDHVPTDLTDPHFFFINPNQIQPFFSIST